MNGEAGRPAAAPPRTHKAPDDARATMSKQPAQTTEVMATMATEGLVLYLGIYDDPARAERDFEELAELHRSGRVGTYDAALVEKDEHGGVTLRKREKPTQHAAWTGIGAGAVLGLLFPPSIIAGAVVGGLAGGLTGHLWKGMSRADVKELGEALDSGDAALIVVGAPALREQTERILSGARQRVVKQLDVDHHEFAAALAEAESDVASGSGAAHPTT
jgi:uncharacterized membrane protein